MKLELTDIYVGTGEHSTRDLIIQIEMTLPDGTHGTQRTTLTPAQVVKFEYEIAKYRHANREGTDGIGKVHQADERTEEGLGRQARSSHGQEEGPERG